MTTIPDGFSSITPYITFDDTNEAIAHYIKALGAQEIMRIPGPDGSVMHAEIQIGNARMMMGNTCPEKDNRSARMRPATQLDCNLSNAQYLSSGGTQRQLSSLYCLARDGGSDQHPGSFSNCSFNQERLRLWVSMTTSSSILKVKSTSGILNFPWR